MTMNRYIAGAPMKIYIVGLNKIFEVSVKLMINLLKPSLKQRLAFVDKLEQIEELISLDEVPVHAGGRATNFVRIPPNVRSGKCLAHLSYINPKDWDIFRDINMIAIQEGMRDTNTTSVEQFLRGCEQYFNKSDTNSRYLG